MEDAIVHIQAAQDIPQIEACIQESQAKHAFIDTETTGLDPLSDKLILIQVMAGDRVFIINVAKIGSFQQQGAFYEPVIRILEDKSVTKVGHNLKFDVKFLSRFFHPRRVNFQNLFDTYLSEELLFAGRELKPGSSTLQALAEKYAGIRLDKTEKTSFRDGSLTPSQIDYAANDVRALKPIFDTQAKQLHEKGLAKAGVLEFSVIPAVAQIELSGIKMDLSKLEALKAVYKDKLFHVEAELNLLVYLLPVREQQTLVGMGVNYDSQKQMKDILWKLGFKVENTDNETLEAITHPFAQYLIEYRKLSKIISTFIESLPQHVHKVTGRIHADFFQLGAGSGRFSCAEPNLQQIPREQEWRDLFVAGQGYKMITADYSQIELRILAEYSKDPAFLDAYMKGQDLHSKTAAAIFNIPPEKITKEQRNTAKTINFGICYGMGPQGLASSLKIQLKEAEKFINTYFRSYPKVKRCLDSLGRKAVKEGYSETMSGRKRYFSIPEGLDEKERFRAEKAIERKGRNTPIQGTCGDILKRAIQLIHNDIASYDARIVNIVHDEIVIEVAEAQAEQVAPIVKKDMIQAAKHYLRTVPVEVDIAVDTVWKK